MSDKAYRIVMRSLGLTLAVCIFTVTLSIIMLAVAR